MTQEIQNGHVDNLLTVSNIVGVARRKTANIEESPTRYQQRLIQLYTEQVKSQGLCDYPPLVEVMKIAYRAEQDSSLLLPSEVMTLVQKLEDYQHTHGEIIHTLRLQMDEMGEVFDSMAKVANSGDLRDIMGEIYQVLEQFDQIVIQLQGLTQRFQDYPTKWWHWFLPLDSQSKQLFYLCESLQYCHHYLVSHLSLGNLVKAKQEQVNWLTFAKRLYAYVDESMSVMGQLTSLLQQRIYDRQATL